MVMLDVIRLAEKHEISFKTEHSFDAFVCLCVLMFVCVCVFCVCVINTSYPHTGNTGSNATCGEAWKLDLKQRNDLTRLFACVCLCVLCICLCGGWACVCVCVCVYTHPKTGNAKRHATCGKTRKLVWNRGILWYFARLFGQHRLVGKGCGAAHCIVSNQVWCRVLLCVAACYRVLQRVAAWCRVLQWPELSVVLTFRY